MKPFAIDRTNGLCAALFIFFGAFFAIQSLGLEIGTAFRMNTQMKPTAILQNDITPEGSDYEVVRRAIEKISLDYRDQPSLEALAADVGETPTGLQKLFTRWAGLSPKAFLQAVTLDHGPHQAH